MLGVVQDRLGRHRPQRLQQLARVPGPGELPAVAHPEDELPEPHGLPQEALQVLHDPAGVLVDEEGVQRLGAAAVLLGLGRLDADRQLGQLAAQQAQQLEAGVVVHPPGLHEAHVRYHPEDVRLVAPVDVQRLLEAPGQQDLRTRAHPQLPMQVVQPLVDQAPGHLHDRRVDGRQKGGVVRDRVLHEKHQAHTARAGVVVGVGQVLDVLDDRHQQGRVVLPEEDAVHDPRRRLVLELRQRRRVGRQHHDGQLLAQCFDLPGKVEGELGLLVHDGEHQVDALGPDGLERALDARHLADAGHGREAPIRVLLPDAFLEGPVLLDDVGVVDAGDEQDLTHPARHERAERVEAVLDGIEVEHG